MTRLIWLHDESLAMPKDISAGDQLIYIWDDAYFAEQQWTFKRLVFIYETLCQLPVQVWHGETVAVLRQLVDSLGTDTIMVQSARDPVLKRYISQAIEIFPQIEESDAPTLVPLSEVKNSRRFHHFWQQLAPNWSFKVHSKRWHHEGNK